MGDRARVVRAEPDRVGKEQWVPSTRENGVRQEIELKTHKGRV